MNRPIFAFGSDSPADLLTNAANVLDFLADMTPAMAAGGPNLGLDDNSAHGLCLILQAVEATVKEACKQL